MTRKDYELISNAIATAWHYSAETKSQISNALADALFLDNPRFDRLRFLVACGVVEAPMKTVSRILEAGGK